MSCFLLRWSAALLVPVAFGCSSSEPSGNAGGSGSSGVAGGSAGNVSGGASSGSSPGGTGATSAGGTTSGGSASTGGATTGGVATAGAGGASSGAGNGGVSSAGAGNGGMSSAGAGNGGMSSAGAGNGGMSSGGASSGGASSGGASGSGAGGGGMSGGGSGGAGTSGGGAGGTGGAGGGGSCSTAPTGTCAAPTVRITNVTLSSAVVTPFDVNSDTEPLPFAISAIPSGGSRLAWMGTDGKVYVGKLDCEDKLTGTPFSFPANDFQDIYADDDGGVLLVTRPATGSGTAHCGAGPLCGTPKSDPCFDMYLVRFDNAGNEVWATKVTNTSANLEPYSNGARFIWDPYQHHGRIAFDGSNFASYFCIGITAQNNACVDIHEGDRMQVVNSSGSLVANHPDSFQVGCSHSWTTRMVWDPRSKHFVTVCATDNNCRLARPAYQTIASATCDGHFFGGDVVLAKDSGYWTSYSSGGPVHLAHFVTAAADKNLTDVGNSDHSHLVSYGANNMIVAYGTNSSLNAQVRDAGTGATVGSFSIAVPEHPFQAFKPYPDGSVAFPAKGANNTSAKIARVMACPG
jgi:hypothetical protein